MTIKSVSTKEQANLDPISGEPGAHPVGTGLGAAVGGAAAGAAAGTVAGPVGTAVGAAVGAIAGGLAGKAAAEAVDPTAELAYWEENFPTRQYAANGAKFDDYSSAYAYGVDSYPKYSGRSFDDAETELSTGWNRARGKSTLTWDKARHATRDAWERVKNAVS